MSEAIKYEYLEHWISKQSKAENEMLDELHSGNYTLENPLVKLNPYFINPLAAVVLFNTEEEIAITITVKGKTKTADFSHTFEKAKEHVLPILGLYNNYDNKVEIRPYRKEAVTITIPVEDVVPDILVHCQTTPEYFQDHIMIVSPAGLDHPCGYDYAGDVRFYLEAMCVFDYKRLRNGNLLIGTDRLLKMPYYMTGLYEMSPVGKIYKEYRIPGGYHHDQFEMEDGNLLVLTDDLNSETVEDKCVLIDRETGDVLKRWDYLDFLTQGDGAGVSYTDEDWFHNNAVWYDKNTNSLTFSGRHVDAMVNIDFDTGTLNWIIGDPRNWSEEKQKYFFKPVGNNFEWQYEQHACLITPNGDVMCFDNHHNDTKFESEKRPAKDSYSRGVRYRIDTDKMEIEQVWSYGKERGAEFFSPYICNVEYYNEGHYLVHSGGIAYDAEGNPSEALGPYSAMAGGTMYSCTTEVYEDKKLYELKVKGNFYRAEKLKLYSDGINLELGKGKILGVNDPVDEMETEVPAEFTGEMMPEDCNAHIEDEFDKFTFYSRFVKGDLVLLQLENDEEIHRYFISTTATPNKAMCCGSFLDTDDRNIRTCITKNGLSGTYKVRVIINDKKYETGIEITC